MPERCKRCRDGFIKPTGLGLPVPCPDCGTSGFKRPPEPSLRVARPEAPANEMLAALKQRLAALFHDAAQGPKCEICGEEQQLGTLHAHHVLDRQFLERELERRVTPERLLGIVWDVRNALGACETCHNGHHGPSVESRITRAHVRPAVWEFAKELDGLVADERFSVRLEAYREARAA